MHWDCELPWRGSEDPGDLAAVDTSPVGGPEIGLFFREQPSAEISALGRFAQNMRFRPY